MNDENIKDTAEEQIAEAREDMDIDIEMSTSESKAENEETTEETPDKTAELEEKLNSANDQYLRLCAEYDNYRKRTAREKTECYGDATVKCLQDILPVLDNFERAIDAECADESFKNGMTMIYNQFGEALKKIGVTEMEALGQEFDPNIHNAIKQEESEEYGENTVCQVFQKGYMLGDRVIRHAVVAVTA